MTAERPTGPEMELLAEIVSEHDRQLDEMTPADKEQAWLNIVNAIIPSDVLAHVAVQRAMRAAGVTDQADLIEHLARVTQLSAAWVDGFAAGAAYQEEHRRWRRPRV